MDDDSDVGNVDKVVDLRDTPTSIDIDALGRHDSVLTALAAHYERNGTEVQQLWVGDLEDGTSAMFDLYVPSLHRVVDVIAVENMISMDPLRYGPWRAAGYETWVIAPKAKFERVERRLSKAVDHIQPWSIDGPKVIFDALPVS